MSLFTSAARFARSPAGRKALEKARTMAADPKNKQKIDDLRRRLADRQRPADPPAAGPPPVDPPAKA